MKRWQFYVGVMRSRTVTVRAETEDDARLKASEELDRRAEKRGDEAPVAWTLTLKSE